MAKTATFGVLHLGTSFGVTFAMTGNLAVAGAVTFVEPLVNTVMHHFFDKHWEQFRGWLIARRPGQTATAAVSTATQGAV